jgi:macrolide-specific efflux system membrane fusion protein
VVAGFAEADATKISPGQTATVTLSALPSTTLPGKVTALSPTSTIVSNVVTYNVTVDLTQPPSDVKPGMTASLSVVVASAANVLEVPTSAITGAGRLSTVTVLTGGKQEVRTVTTGLVGDTSTQIVSGLSSGNVVVEPSVSAGGAGSGTGSSSRTGTLGGGFFGGGGLGGGGLGGGGLGGGVTRGG